MKPASEWTEADIQGLIATQRQEDLSLDYKRADSLENQDRKKTEISKDVSAMANSAGGDLIYGVDEQKNTRGPIRLDAIDPTKFSIEALEQVIDSRIQRRIPNVGVHRIELPSLAPGKLIYTVSVPQSNHAPHMASDHRYYKRLGTTTAVMEEYEVRDVGRRYESPDLELDLEITRATENFYFMVHVVNQSPEPVLYATFRLFTPPNWRWSGGSDWLDHGADELTWNGIAEPFKVFRRSWAVPKDPVLLEGERYPAGTCVAKPLSLLGNFHLGWEVRAPKMLPKLRALSYLSVDNVATMTTESQPLVRAK